jgi:hypothetical protein
MAVTLRTKGSNTQHRILNKQKKKRKEAPFGTAGIGADDDPVLPVRDVQLDVREHEGLRVEVVDGKVEEALDLAGVQIHGDDVVAARDGEHVGDELGSDGRAALVLLVHACVRVARDDGGDAAGRGALARGDEDEKLHEVVVHVAAGRLQNKDVLVADRLGDLHVHLPI